MEIDGNCKNSSFMFLFSNITFNTSQTNQIKDNLQIKKKKCFTKFKTKKLLL